MPKASPGQVNFSGGEFSPLLHGRVDAERFATGLDTCIGYIPLLQGALHRCPGTKHAGLTASEGSKPGLLQRFEFSTTQAYMLVFTDLKLQFYYSDGTPVLEATQAISNITQANPAVVTYVGADNYANGDEVIIEGVVGMTQVNSRRFTVANLIAGSNTFELTGIDSTGYTAYGSVGTVAVVHTVTTPYVEADLFALRFVQSADVLYVAHETYAQRKITRTAHTTWTVTAITFLDGPYGLLNAGATTIAPSATTGTITLTASVAIFASTDVGRLVRLRHSATWGYAKITVFTSTTLVTADVVSDFGAATATAFWRLGVWSDTTGYPSAVTFHDDRLWWGGATNSPQRIDGSKTADYENYAPTDTAGAVADNNAVSATLQSNDVQKIRWLASNEKALLVGTISAEFPVTSSATGAAITPTDIAARPSSYYGSAAIGPVQAGSSTIFVQKSGRKIRELAYTFTTASDSFKAPDLTQVAEHITTGGLVQLAYQQEPHSLVWAVRADGTLISVTYERDADGGLKAAMGRRILGGTSTVGGAQAQATSVAALPSGDGTSDKLWVVVKRYVNSATVYHIEVMESFFKEDTAQEDAYFVDAGITYDSTSTTSIGGLWHLEGETLSVLADGAVQPDVTVTNGTVTLTAAALVAQIGYGFTSRGKMLRLNAGAADGISLGKTQRSNRVSIMFNRSLNLRVGKSFLAADLKRWIFRSTSDNTGEPVPLFTGIKNEPIDMGHSRENQICFDQDQPLPSTILGIMPQLHTQDR